MFTAKLTALKLQYYQGLTNFVDLFRKKSHRVTFIDNPMVRLAIKELNILLNLSDFFIPFSSISQLLFT